LNELRDHLRIRMHMWKTKRRDARGVAANTRAQDAISRQQDKVDTSARKYRVARKALVSLGRTLDKIGWEGGVPPLKPEDVKGLYDDDVVLKGKGKGKEKGKGRVGLGEGKRKLSWIWTDLSAVGQAGDDPGLHDSE
jgi:hypothetical protein